MNHSRSLAGIVNPDRVQRRCCPRTCRSCASTTYSSTKSWPICWRTRTVWRPSRSPILVAARVASGTAGDRVEISVSDQGPGIAAADRDRVFEMFSQNGGGGRAGLGLAIAKAFVEAHGGRIWIDPGVTHGARVVFTVPSENFVRAHVPS